jgi:hypothetical protein
MMVADAQPGGAPKGRGRERRLNPAFRSSAWRRPDEGSAPTVIGRRDVRCQV